MAMTKTTSLQHINVMYGGNYPKIEVIFSISFDDPEDDDLPFIKTESKVLEKMTTTTQADANGDPEIVETPYDYSGEHADVVAVCDAIWS